GCCQFYARGHPNIPLATLWQFLGNPLGITDSSEIVPPLMAFFVRKCLVSCCRTLAGQPSRPVPKRSFIARQPDAKYQLFSLTGAHQSRKSRLMAKKPGTNP